MQRCRPLSKKLFVRQAFCGLPCKERVCFRKAEKLSGSMDVQGGGGGPRHIESMKIRNH